MLFLKETMGNVRINGDIKLVTTERRMNYLVSELNYHTAKFFSTILLAIEIKKGNTYKHKPVDLGISILRN